MAPPGSCKAAGRSTASLEGDSGVGWELVLVLTQFPRAPPTWVKCCWQHRRVNYLETGVKTFYKCGHGRRDFPELPQWGGHCVCPGSPSSAARAALQLCKGAPRGLPRGSVGVPCGARASSSLAGAAQEAPDELGTCNRQAASPSPPTVLSLMERDLSREGEGPCIIRELPCLPTPGLSLPLGRARAEHFHLEAE